MINMLQNYLRTYRKRSGLSQKEIAYLLGCEYGTKLSRYERFHRIPNLKTVLTLEIIYHTESKHLFEGMYNDLAYQLKKRAAILEERINQKPTTPVIEHKLRSLNKLRTTLSDSVCSDSES